MLLANIALPSFIGDWLVFAILFPLITVIEAIVLVQVLKIQFKSAYPTAVSANWRSTIYGLPSAWCMAWMGLIPAGILAAFLPQAYREPSFQIIAFAMLTGGVVSTKFSPIAIVLGNLLMLLPYYLVTVRVERKVVEERHPEIDPKRIAFAVRWMNSISYALLVALLLWCLAVAIRDYVGC